MYRRRSPHAKLIGRPSWTAGGPTHSRFSKVWEARFSKGYFGDELVARYIAKTPGFGDELR
jgi:hypothetical protein